MGLKIIVVDGLQCLALVCDHCGEPIHVTDDDGWGGVYAYEIGGDGSVTTLHRGACHRAYEGKYRTAAISTGWNHLDMGLSNLMWNWLHPFGEERNTSDEGVWVKRWLALTGIKGR